MVRYLIASNGIGFGILWWLLADLSTITRITAAALLVSAVALLTWAASQRARRKQSPYEGSPPQVIRHDGTGDRRSKPKDADPEMFVSDRW